MAHDSRNCAHDPHAPVPVCRRSFGVVVSACSGPMGNPAAVNRDAASRCVQKIDAWKQAVSRLDVLHQEFDSMSVRIHDDYGKASAEEKIKLREKLGGSLPKSIRPKRPRTRCSTKSAGT